MTELSLLQFRALCFVAALLVVHSETRAASLPDADASDSSAQLAALLISMQSCCPEESWPKAESKVADELAVNGFKVDRIEGQAGTKHSRRLFLIQSANAHDAVFSVMILKVPPSVGSGIDIWINDRTANRVVIRHLDVANEDDPDSATLVGLKTIEALQSSLLKISRLSKKEKTKGVPKKTNAVQLSAGLSKKERTGKKLRKTNVIQRSAELSKKDETKGIPSKTNAIEPSVELSKKEKTGKELHKTRAIKSPSQKEVAERRQQQTPRTAVLAVRKRLGLGVGGGVMWSPGNLGGLAELGLSLRWKVIELLSLELDVALSSLIRGISDHSVIATFQTLPIRAWCLYTPLSNYKIRPVVGLGGGIMLVQSKGTGSYPYKGETARTVVGIVGGTGQVVYALFRHLWLRAGVRLSALVPELKLRFSGYPIGSFGKPVLEGFFQLEVRF